MTVTAVRAWRRSVGRSVVFPVHLLQFPLHFFAGHGEELVALFEGEVVFEELGETFVVDGEWSAITASAFFPNPLVEPAFEEGPLADGGLVFESGFGVGVERWIEYS